MVAHRLLESPSEVKKFCLVNLGLTQVMLLIIEIIHRWGIPGEIINDDGTSFLSAALRRI